jgi:hypothetical protein
VPVSFTDLYHPYADGWRVQADQSLFGERSEIKPGIPDKPFHAADLNPRERATALKLCQAARIRAPALLEACVLDTVVLRDAAAARGFTHVPVPRAVIKPVWRGGR